MITPISSPHTAPIAVAMRKPRKVLSILSYLYIIPMVIPAKARVEVIEISIPPISSTHNMPSAMIIITELFFKISSIFCADMKFGLLMVTAIHKTIRTMTRLASREPVILFSKDFFSIISQPPLSFSYRSSPWQIPEWPPELPPHGLIHR